MSTILLMAFGLASGLYSIRFGISAADADIEGDTVRSGCNIAAAVGFLILALAFGFFAGRWSL